VAAATVLLATGAAPVGVDPSSRVTFEGPVVAFTGGYGAGLPTLTVEDSAEGEVAVRLGPFWFLAEAGFTAAVGDLVRITAYPCTLCDVGWVAATVENLSTGASVALRDERGAALWVESAGPGPGTGPGPNPGGSGGNGPATNGQDGKGPGPNGPNPGVSLDRPAGPPAWAPFPGFGACGGAGMEVGDIATATGTVVTFSGKAGGRFPTLILQVGADELTLVAGPLRVWLAAGFEPEAGQELEVTYARVTLADGSERLLLLAMTDPESGLTLVFRDPETGRPLGGCCAKS